MATFTSTLPDQLLQLLDKKARELSMPKNKLLERAVLLYLEHLNRAAYLKSYKQMANDEHLVKIAEEGMADYFKQIEEGE